VKIVNFIEYVDTLTLIGDLNKLPNEITVDGVILRKSFRDTNLVEHSKYLMSSRIVRHVACSFGGINSSGKFIVAEIECNHYNICGGMYNVRIRNKSILDKVLAGDYQC
jgi:hypothetical protein